MREKQEDTNMSSIRAHVYIRAMKKFLTALFLLFLISFMYAQKNISSVIKEQAKKMEEALMKGDYKVFVQFSLPALVDSMGGVDEMTEITKSGMEEMEKNGFTIIAVTFGNPSEICQTKKNWQCTLLQNIILKAPEGKVVNNSTLVGVSYNNGKNWYFIDAAGKSREQIKLFIPELCERIKIPEAIQPVFYKE